MKFVGADLHKKSITFCVVELDGRATKVVAQKRILCNQVQQIAQFLQSLGEQKRGQVSLLRRGRPRGRRVICRSSRAAVRSVHFSSP
jgi:hypothetical protein